MRISIVIPAYNEEKRIYRTLAAYTQFFKEKMDAQILSYEIIVVLNGCIDNTHAIVERAAQELSNIILIDLCDQRGKGHAIKTGFLDALERPNDLIGFVDADMATQPADFFELINTIQDYDGIIASRYMADSLVYPARPRYKRWGSRFVYEPLIRLLFGLSYYDYQCGAKLFKCAVIEAVAHQLTVKQWAFDVELLWQVRKHQFVISERPTVWTDQADSKLSLRAGLRMVTALIKLRFRL